MLHLPSRFGEGIPPAGTSRAVRCLFQSACIALLICLALAATAQTNQWVWMGGQSTMIDNQGNFISGGVYDAQGVFAPGNMPGMRDGAVTWTDKKGNLWLFGGSGAGVQNSSGRWSFGLLNDLWEFNPAINQWAFIAGDAEVGSDCAYYSSSNGAGICGCSIPTPCSGPGSAEVRRYRL